MDLVAGRTWSRERAPIRHLDPVLLAATLALSLIGLFMIFSATRPLLDAQNLNPYLDVKKQVTALTFGVIMLLLAATFDYRFAKVYAGLIYAGMVVLLVLVRTPLGTSSLGAQRGFTLGGFQFTPSEPMKVALVIMLAAFLSELKTYDLSLQQVYRATFIAAIPMALVFIQPDIGTTIVLSAVLFGALIVAGARPRHLAVLALSAMVLLFGAFQLGVIQKYQVQRLTSFLAPQNSSADANYNRNQSEITIGSGGITGTGYLEGIQTNLAFVPEQHTDFIFTVVGEQFGFIGALALLLLFALLLWRAFRIAVLSKDPFGTYVAAGIAAMFAIQMFVNIGMTIGIMPITGIPLPFVSYGGSSLMANFIAVGLLLNIHMRRFK